MNRTVQNMSQFSLLFFAINYFIWQYYCFRWQKNGLDWMTSLCAVASKRCTKLCSWENIIFRNKFAFRRIETQYTIMNYNLYLCLFANICFQLQWDSCQAERRIIALRNAIDVNLLFSRVTTLYSIAGSKAKTTT